MSTHPRRHPIRKRQWQSTQHSSLFKHILRPLASKGKVSPSHPETPALQLEHNNTRDEQHIEAPATRTTDVKLQHPVTSQSLNIYPVSSDHDFIPSPLLSPNSTVPSLERNQYTAVAPSTNIYSNRVPLTSADDGFPEFAPGTLLSGVVTCESHGLPTPYGSLQLQETIKILQGQGYWVPTLNIPEVRTAMAIGVHQNQSPQPTADQYSVGSTQQLPVQPPYHAPFQQNSRYAACINCPSIWRSHFESITFSSLENKGISELQRSYRDLQQHIHVAHLWHHGAGCALCENMFCYHLGKMMHLEVATGDFADVKIKLGSSFMTLREHIQEAHGGC